MAKKYYVVKKGKKPGVYTTWSDCKSQVDGFSGALYKSFESLEEAKKFLYGDLLLVGDKSSMDKNTNVGKDIKSIAKRLDYEKLVAYVDGSYSKSLKVYSGGSVIIYKDKIIELSQVASDSSLVDMRNVAGELLGVRNVIDWIRSQALKNVSVEFHYDYEGIERWANYEWKANKEGTKDYQKFINDFRSLGNEVLFVKVKAHSGVFYNEEADRLAKEAISKYQKEGQVTIDRSFSIEKLSDDKSPVSETKASSYGKLFEKAFKIDKENKSSFTVLYSGYDLSEKNALKFIKSIWKSNSYLIKDIKDIEVILDIKEKTLSWKIYNSSGQIIEDEYDF